MTPYLIFTCLLHTGKPASLSDKENIDWAPSQNLGHNLVKTVDQKCDARLLEEAAVIFPGLNVESQLENENSDLNQHGEGKNIDFRK